MIVVSYRGRHDCCVDWRLGGAGDGSSSGDGAALRREMEEDEAVPLPFRRPPGDDDRPWALPRGWDGRGGGPAEEVTPLCGVCVGMWCDRSAKMMKMQVV